MLEVRLRCGQVVAFDGRVVEVFADGGPSRRFHLAQLETIEAVEAADGVTTVELEGGAVTLAFAREEAPACGRLLAAIAQAQGALASPFSVG
jgi:hypothetical protein